MVVLDTTFLIAIERGDAPALARLAAFRENADPLRVPAAVWIEYLSPMRPAERSRAARALDASATFEPATREVAEAAARLQHDLASRGARLGWHDLQIAATALHYGEALVTNDAAFAVVPGLEPLPH